MFGRHWEPAQATVVARKKHVPNPGTRTYYWEYVLDVQPAEGGSVFRATVDSNYNVEPIRFVDADVGEVIPVFCDVKRKKVKLDTSEQKAQNHELAKAQKAEWDAAVHGAPGTPAVSGGRPMSTGTNTGGDGHLDKLKELGELHRTGVLTDEEFAAEKARILGGS